MPSYPVDIEVGVKGQQRLQALTAEINKSDRAANSLAKALGKRGVVAQSLNNYTKALETASRVLGNVIAGTPGEIKAIREYASALSDLVAVEQRQKKLIGAEFRATAAGQAELEATKARKSLEIKRRQRELEGQQARERQAIQEALGRMEFEQAARRREFLAQGTRELKEQLSLAKEKINVEKRPVLGGQKATAFGPEPDRLKRLRRAEIFDRTAAARRENEERRQQFKKLEDTAKAARLKRVREENRDFQQQTADRLQAKDDEAALQKKLGEMEKRSQVLADKKNKSLQRSLEIGKKVTAQTVRDVKSQKAKTDELKRQNDLQKQQRRDRLRGAIGSGLIGGGFPLLFGQTGAAAVGGAIGGLGGGLIGGELGFALSIVGTAIGQAVAEAEKFDKALAAVNAKATSLGSAAQGSAKDVKDLAKQLGVTKDEALELLNAFSAFESFADKQALVSIFGDDSSAFDRLAAAKTELDLAKEIFATRDDIGVGEAKRLLNMLKIQDASVVELALAEARLQAEHDIAVEQAKQVTFMDRLNAAVVTAGMAGLGGGVIDPAEFGRQRAEKLEKEFQENSQRFLETFAEKVRQVRDLLSGVEFFDPGKPPTAAESGETLEQSLRRQLARYEEIEPFARKIAVIEADHLATKEKIAKVTNDETRKTLETLANKLRQARLDDVEAQKKEQRAKDEEERIRRENKLRDKRMNMMLKENEEFKKAQQEQLEMAEKIAGTIQSGFVDSIKAATSETQKLSDVLSNMLNRLADQLLQVGTNQLLFGNTQGAIQSGIGLLGSLFPSLGGRSGGGGAGKLIENPLDAFMRAGIEGPIYDGTRALGGSVAAGQSYLVGERGPEMFVPGAQGNIVPNSAMGGANVTVNVDASGSSVEGDADQAAQLGKMLGAAVQAELVKQKRPGGLLAS